MADELKQSQLARIVVPAITDVKYAEGMADAFDKINDNFKKIASLPFLQGVQGDSYQLEEYKIWNDNWTITEDGKVLLNSIFGKDVTVDGNSFTDIRNYIDEKLEGVSPLDFFKNGNDIVNNSLYFYVIKDDTGNVIEKQLGQFYYFIDERLKKIGDSYNNGNVGSTLDTFNDYTGFYQYKYDAKSNDEKYIRLEILPSIYYDQDKNDICWKFNGIKTGISSIGVPGEAGKDAQFSIVKVTADITNVSGVVEAEFIYDKSNNTGMWETDATHLNNIKDSKAIICCYYENYEIDGTTITVKGEKLIIKDLPSSGNKKGDGWLVQGVLFAWNGTEWKMIPQGLNFAYGEIIRGEDGILCAYWNQGSMMSHVMNNLKITSYFYDMGESQNASAPHYLAIPTVVRRGSSEEDQQKAHTIKSDGDNLVFENTTDALTSPSQQNPTPTAETKNKDVILNNYNLKVNDVKDSSKSTYIKGGEITLKATGKTSTFGHTTNITDNLSVGTKLTVGKKDGTVGKFATELHGTVNMYDGYLFINPRLDKYKAANGNSLIVKSGDVYLENGNISVGAFATPIKGSGDIRAFRDISAIRNIISTGGSITSANDITATNGNLTVGGIGSIKGTTLTLGTETTTGRSTTIIKNSGSTDSKGITRSNFSLDVNGLEYGHERYFTINSSSPVYKSTGDNYNTARITLGSPTGSTSKVKENYIQICAGEDGIFGNTGARAGIQIHASSDGASGDVTIKPNLTVQGPATVTGKATLTGGATINGGVEFSGGAGTIKIGQTGGVQITGGMNLSGGLNVNSGFTQLKEGLKVCQGETKGIEFYSGDGSATNNNILKVNSTAVTVGGNVGKLLLNGTNSSMTIKGAYDSAKEIGSDLSKITDTSHPGYIYLGDTPDEKKSAINRLLINRHAIQSYTTYKAGANAGDPGTYQAPIASSFRINPCGGNVSIGSINSAKSDLTVSGSLTGASGIKVYGGISEFYSGNGTTSDNNILKVNSNEVSVDGNKGLLKVKDRIVVNSLNVYEKSNGGAKSGGGNYGLEDLIKGSEGNIHCGGNSNVSGSDTAYRTVYNRSALQAYSQSLNGTSQKYTTATFYINPNGGPVLIGRSANGKSSSLTVNGTASITGKATLTGGATISGGVEFSGGGGTIKIDPTPTNGVQITGGMNLSGGLNVNSGNLVIPGASPADPGGLSSYDKDTSSDLNILLESGNNGQLLIGLSKDSKTGTNRMFLNRATIQTYSYNSNTYTGTDLYLNPGGGNVVIGNTNSLKSNLTLYGRIYARGAAGVGSGEGARFIGCTGTTGAAGADGGSGGNGLVVYAGTGGVNTDNTKLPGKGGYGAVIYGGNGCANPNRTGGPEANGVTGGTGVLIYGGTGGQNGQASKVSGNGGHGLVVYGGNAYQDSSNTSGSGGFGIYVRGGKDYDGNISPYALKTVGNIYISDTSNSYTTTLSTDSKNKGFKINNTTTITGGATIDGGLNVNNAVLNANQGLNVSGGNVNIDTSSNGGSVWIKENGTTTSRICIGKPESSQNSKGIHIYNGAKLHSGNLHINSTHKLLIGNLNSNETEVDRGIEINYSSGNTSSIKFRGQNINNSNYSNQMVITTNADTTNKYTVGRLYMDNNYDKQYIQIFAGHDKNKNNPIYGNSNAGIQIFHDEGNSASDCVSIKPKLSVDGSATISGGATITGLTTMNSGANITGNASVSGSLTYGEMNLNACYWSPTSSSSMESVFTIVDGTRAVYSPKKRYPLIYIAGKDETIGIAFDSTLYPAGSSVILAVQNFTKSRFKIMSNGSSYKKECNTGIYIVYLGNNTYTKNSKTFRQPLYVLFTAAGYA
jgi:hypothetical protein